MSAPNNDRLKKLAGLKVEKPTPKKKAAVSNTAVSVAAKVGGKKVVAQKKGLPAKAAAKKAVTTKAKAAAAQPPKTKNPAMTDEEFLDKADQMLEGLGKELLTVRTKMFALAANGHEEYAAKGDVPTEYESVQQEVFDIEDKITSMLGCPADYWDIDDQGNIGWDEEALDDPTLFDEDGVSLTDEDVDVEIVNA